MAKTKRERLSELIKEQLHANFGIEVENVRLYPARGFWRTNKRLADVMPWTGYADAVFHTEHGSGRYTICLGSWDTMTDLLRLQPVSIEKDATNGYELYAGHRAAAPDAQDVR